jgi:hypothetical protein
LCHQIFTLSFLAKKNNWVKNFKEYSIKHRREKINQKCLYCKKTFLFYKNVKRKFCSKECRNKGSKYINHSNSGGYRKNSGRGKQGWYKGYYCQSSWELAWVIYSLENNIIFDRNKNGFEYIFENKKYKYYPDFYLLNQNLYIEIKGYPNNKNNAKISQFPYNLKILYKNEMKEILGYVIKKYGNNFIELYEGNPHKIKKNSCIICGEPAKNKYCSRSCSGKSVSKLSPFCRNN